MYEYVPLSEVSPYKTFYLGKLVELKQILARKYQIKVKVCQVGSGQFNLVTRNNENGDFDLDFNLRVVSMPSQYENDLKKLKYTVTTELDKLISDVIDTGHDRSSCIQYRLNSPDRAGYCFMIDIALVRHYDGYWQRLTKDNESNQYIWNGITHRQVFANRLAYIREQGKMGLVKERYLEKKNMYLRRNDFDHPSITILMETVNDVFQIID